MFSVLEHHAESDNASLSTFRMSEKLPSDIVFSVPLIAAATSSLRVVGVASLIFFYFPQLSFIPATLLNTGLPSPPFRGDRWSFRSATKYPCRSN
jgi:hypothetical protein